MIKKRVKISENQELPQGSTIMEMSEQEFAQTFHVEIKTFKDQAIDVLNILEKSGIDIYAPDRTPGMHLRQNKSKVLSFGIKNQFKQKNSENNQIPETNISDNLKNFFKSKNNNK